jgi:hypothetical protein
MAGEVDDQNKTLIEAARAVAGRANLMATLLLWREGRINTLTACFRLNQIEENETWLRQILAEALEMASR